MKRRKVFTSLSVLAAGVAGAGCLGQDNEESDQTPTPMPESTVSDDEAKLRAYEAETEHVREVVESTDCVSGSIEVGYPYSEFTSIEKRTEDGVIVSVEHPYWYTTEEGHEVHTESEATYIVTAETSERTEGSDIDDPCID